MSWFRKKKPAPEPAPEPVEAPVPTLNPTDQQTRAFADWRAAHIDRWLERNEHTAPAAKVEHLRAERDMYRAMLRMQS